MIFSERTVRVELRIQIYVLVEEILEVRRQAGWHCHWVLLHLLPLTQGQQHEPQVPHVPLLTRLGRQHRVLGETHVGLLKNVLLADVAKSL